LTTLNLSGNDIGPTLPSMISSLNLLEELNVADNQLTKLDDLPEGLVSLYAARNHLGGMLSLNNKSGAALSCLTEVHVKGNRLIGVHPGMGAACESLDFLDLSDNRVVEVAKIVGGIKEMKELRELTVGGNKCTPRDENGKVYGAACLEWWYEVLSGGAGELEILDDLLCTGDDVKETVAGLKRKVS